MSRIRCGKPKRGAILPRHTSRPWEKVGVDIFTFSDKNYLITTDHFSNYFEIERLPSKRIFDIVYILKQQFARHGIPSIVFSNNSSINSQEFRNFAELYEFAHQTSSPRYRQSNGKTENAVRTAKRFMTKAVESARDQFLALLDWRNTLSKQLRQSPVQILFGRRTRTRMPTAKCFEQNRQKQLKTRWQRPKPDKPAISTDTQRTARRLNPEKPFELKSTKASGRKARSSTNYPSARMMPRCKMHDEATNIKACTLLSGTRRI